MSLRGRHGVRLPRKRLCENRSPRRRAGQHVVGLAVAPAHHSRASPASSGNRPWLSHDRAPTAGRPLMSRRPAVSFGHVTHAGAAARRGQTNRLGVLQVRLDAGDDHAGLDRQKLDADQRHLRPNVDHDALVQNAVHHFGQAGRVCGFLNVCHSNSPFRKDDSATSD